MMKEVEVGDEYVGKVVKTTTFGAFVELSKGTDGLLHISNVSPGERVESVEDVLNRGDEIIVRVVEVDRERGRIGLRLAEDPEIAGKTVEELAGMAAAAVAVVAVDARRATADLAQRPWRAARYGPRRSASAARAGRGRGGTPPPLRAEGAGRSGRSRERGARARRASRGTAGRGGEAE